MLSRFMRSLGGRKKTKDVPKINKVQRKGNIKYGFYDSVRWTLHICRCAGFLPISGLTQPDSDLTKCTLKSPYTLILVASIALQGFWVVIEVYDNIVTPFDFKKFAAFFYALVSFLFTLLLIPFSIKWKKMIVKIEKIERSLPPLKNSRKAVRKTNRMMIFIFCFGILENLVYVIYTVKMTSNCYLLPDDTGFYLKSYFMTSFGWLFKYIPFSYSFSFIIRFSKFQFAFLWSFIDILIVIFSLHLVFRFRDFNRIMEQHQRNKSDCQLTSVIMLTKEPDQIGSWIIIVVINGVTRLPWLELQAYYTRLTRLVKIIDKNVNKFVLLSFISNLCFIGQQVFYLMNKIYKRNKDNQPSYCIMERSTDWLTTINLYVSVSFLITRTALVSVFPARLNSLSRQPLDALHTIPASAYDQDLQRFMDQVHFSKIGLSGLGFFYVTRGMILSVAATLMTYELVLLQF